MAYSLLPAPVSVGEVSLLSTWTVTNFNGDTATGALSLKILGCIIWDKYPEHTEHLLDYLDTHPDIAIKLFSDSTQAAKSEGCFKLTAKLNKGAAYLQLANGIFFVDDDSAVWADFVINPNKYAKAVNNYITNMYVLS